MGKSVRSLFWDEPGKLSLLAARVATERPVAPPLGELRSTVVEPTPPAPPSAAEAGKERLFAAQAGSVEERLGALLRWLREVVSLRQAFVSDAEGLALVEENSSAALIAAASVVGESWREVHGGLGLPDAESFSVDLATGERLRVLAMETDWGRLTLGFVTQEPVPGETLSLIGDAFRRCLKMDEEPEGVDHDT